MKNKNLINFGWYVLIFLAGLLLGYILLNVFSNDSSHDQDHNNDHDHELEAEHTGISGDDDVVYTCSMHPQVRQEEEGDCPICGMELIPASEEDDTQEDDLFLFTMQDMHSEWANVKTSKVEAIHATGRLRLTGKLAANESETRRITAHFPGRIEELFIDYQGAYISRGDKLASFYSPEMKQAQQELLSAASDKEQRSRLYESARSRLKHFRLTPEQIDAIEERGEAVANMDVHASRDGYITQMAVREGEYVDTGQLLYEIANLDEVWVELDVYEEQLRHIETGQEVTVNVNALPDNAYSGQVEFVDPVIDPRTRSARVRLGLDNPGHLLKPEMLVNAVVDAVDTHEKQLVVPATAVLWTGKRSLVYVKQPERDGFTFEFREIETDARLEEGYQVVSGLSEGEEIAVNGVFAIDAAAQMRGHYSMMAPPERTVLPEPFQSNLEALFDRYFALKNALADDESAHAADRAGEVLEQLHEIDEHSLEGEHHVFWMERYADIEESLDNLLEADDIAEQRMYFEPLSEAFINTAQTLGAIGQTYYVAFCPMYDDDRGAYWLSEFEEIKNPYFGDMMLRCGEVRETIRAGIGDAERETASEMEGHAH